eukprot:COSAG02_NODE_329_length_24516_cov_11.403448_8_plen_90_part_00
MRLARLGSLIVLQSCDRRCIPGSHLKMFSRAIHSVPLSDRNTWCASPSLPTPVTAPIGHRKQGCGTDLGIACLNIWLHVVITGGQGGRA